MWFYLAFMVGGFGLLSLVPTDKEIWEKSKEELRLVFWDPDLPEDEQKIPFLYEQRKPVVYGYYKNEDIPNCDDLGPEDKSCYINLSS
jgi:hypothetical protein